VGPVTLVERASKTENHDDLVKKLVPLYKELLESLKALGVPEVCIHEPSVVFSKTGYLQKSFEDTYKTLSSVGVNLSLASYFEDVGDNYKWLTNLPVNKIHLDFTRGDNIGLIEKHGFPSDKILSAGVVDGRSVFKDTVEANALLKRVSASVKNVEASTSCSLQHSPYDLAFETKLPEEITDKLSFSLQKIEDLIRVANGEGETKVYKEGAKTDLSNTLADSFFNRSEDYATRRPKQPKLPNFPTTAIGS
jgi:5-methyltetrahydropteroyltriglutamate--homocysteine methyltransferase